MPATIPWSVSTLQTQIDNAYHLSDGLGYHTSMEGGQYSVASGTKITGASTKLLVPPQFRLDMQGSLYEHTLGDRAIGLKATGGSGYADGHWLAGGNIYSHCGSCIMDDTTVTGHLRDTLIENMRLSGQLRAIDIVQPTFYMQLRNLKFYALGSGAIRVVNAFSMSLYDIRVLTTTVRGTFNEPTAWIELYGGGGQNNIYNPTVDHPTRTTKGFHFGNVGAPGVGVVYNIFGGHIELGAGADIITCDGADTYVNVYGLVNFTDGGRFVAKNNGRINLYGRHYVDTSATYVEQNGGVINVINGN